MMKVSLVVRRYFAGTACCCATCCTAWTPPPWRSSWSTRSPHWHSSSAWKISGAGAVPSVLRIRIIWYRYGSRIFTQKNSDPDPVQTFRLRIRFQGNYTDPVSGKLYESGGSGSETLRTILMGMGLNGSAHVRYVKNIGRKLNFASFPSFVPGPLYCAPTASVNHIQGMAFLLQK